MSRRAGPKRKSPPFLNESSPSLEWMGPYKERFMQLRASLENEQALIQEMQKILSHQLIDLQMEESQLQAMYENRPWDSSFAANFTSRDRASSLVASDRWTPPVESTINTPMEDDETAFDGLAIDLLDFDEWDFDNIFANIDREIAEASANNQCE